MGVRADAFNGSAHAADACLVQDCPRADVQVHAVCVAVGSCRCDASVGPLAVVMSSAMRCVSIHLVVCPQSSQGDS